MNVVCSSMSGPGHAYPMLAVARALVERGHETTFLSGWVHAPEAERIGCRHIVFPDTDGSSRWELRPYDDAAAMAESLAPIVRETAPDVLVHDLVTLGPALAAEMAGARTATLVIHPLHTPSRDLPPFGFGGPAGRGILRLRDEWMRRANRRDLERAREDLNRARARLGLEPVSRLDGALSPDLVLVATLPSLEVPRSDWPERAHVIGPCLWPSHGPLPALPDGDAPLVLVAPSTAHDQRVFVRAALEAVGRLGARGVLSTGESTEVPASLPSGVVAAAFVPHDDLLPLCAAVVCSGGHGIVARALSHGVPLVVVPGHGDQRENGYRVERSGGGLRVLRPNGPRIHRALARMLGGERYRVRAREIQGEAASMDGPARAVELVEGLMESSPLH